MLTAPMKRAAAIALPAIALALSLSSAFAAEKLPLDQLSSYLNSLTTSKGPFTQINDDGSVSTGTIHIHRPGRMRFEYNPPEDALVVAGGGRVAIFDSKSNLPPEQYPLRLTPLHLILKGNVDLGKADMVVGHGIEGSETFVTAQDPENPEYGSIRLVFTGPPVELRRWVIAGADGSETTVILGRMESPAEARPLLFSIEHEIERRAR